MIHANLWGPYRLPIFDGNKYFLTLVDDFSRMTWLFLLKFNSYVCVVLKFFMSYVKTQFNKNVKVIRTDNGLEFVNSTYSELFNNLGMVHQRTCVYTPQQNRVVERNHIHILEVARAMRFRLIYL